MEPTLFCQIIDRKIPADIVEETDDLIVIKDIHPKAEVHLLIIPKKPVKNIQDFGHDDFVYGEKIFRMAQHLSRTVSNAGAFRLVMNNGEGVGQEVPHAHVHFLAGRDIRHP